MSKLIITISLFMFLFALNAQTTRTFQSNEDWSFKADKGIHLGAGAIIAVPSLLLMYNATNDWRLSINSSIWIPAASGLGKEFLDLFRLWATGQGSGFSFADFSYTVGGAIITTIIITGIYKWKKSRREKRFNIDF